MDPHSRERAIIIPGERQQRLNDCIKGEICRLKDIKFIHTNIQGNGCYWENLNRPGQY